MLAMALLGPSVSPALAAFNGAIWTSKSDGTIVNANLYDNKIDVYLNGGPQNCGNSGGLPDGDYYFQVSDPSGATLLSTDAIKFRQIKVVNGVITGVSGSGNHPTGTGGCNGGLPVRLFPYDDTPNNGGEYSTDMAPVADVADCPSFNENAGVNFLACAGSKNDNFKVRLTHPAINVVKGASPTLLPFGGGSVTYTYIVTNIGDTALSNVTVIDNKCAPVTFVGGDTDGDSKLDLSETWTFTCTTTIILTTTNTVVASGTSGETTVTDQDQATVTVAPPTAPPAITNPPGQSILAVTGTPNVTAPPTDELGSPARPSNDSWRLMLVLLACVLAIALILTPAKATRRK